MREEFTTDERELLFKIDDEVRKLGDILDGIVQERIRYEPIHRRTSKDDRSK